MKRNYGIDLLRITVMLFVAALHIIGIGGVITGAELLSPQFLTAQLLRIAMLCAVDCYALISGFVGWSKQPKLSSLAMLWVRAVIFCVVITGVFSRFYELDYKTLLSAVLPVTTSQYWYLTAYVGLFVAMPLLNFALQKMPKRELTLTLSGILLLLDMESRQWYMSTCGDAIYIFTDYGLDQLGEIILPWLSSGYYYQAFQTWLSELPEYVDAYNGKSPIDGYVKPDEYESPYGDEIIYYYDENIGIGIQPFPIALITGLVAAIVTILIMRSKMNTARLQNGAVDYLKDGSFHLRQRSDMFLYSRVTKTRRQQNTTRSSMGGGSSVHRSSGGVRHGGRGGRF